MLQPVMTIAPKEIARQLGLTEANLDLENLAFGQFPQGVTVVEKGTPIFPRLDAEAEVAYIAEQMSGGKKAEVAEWNPADVKLTSTKEKAIKFEDFDKVEIKVAEVIDCGFVEGADKLLKFRLDAGDEENRQILSGIREFYPEPEKLIGKKVQIIANLKPRKMKGEISQGMILSAEYDGKLVLLEAPAEVPNGSLIG
jgi:methionyl-tRNA synthetase